MTSQQRQIQQAPLANSAAVCTVILSLSGTVPGPKQHYRGLGERAIPSQCESIFSSLPCPCLFSQLK